MSNKRITVKKQSLKVIEDSVAERLFPRLELESLEGDDLVSRLRRELFENKKDKSEFSRDDELIATVNEGLESEDGFGTLDSFVLFTGKKWTPDPRLAPYDRHVQIKSPFEVSSHEFDELVKGSNLNSLFNPCEVVKTQFEKLERIASSTGRQIGARLRRVLFSKSQSRTQYDQEAGTLNRRALSQMLASPTVFNRLHQKKVEGEKLDTHVELLIDLSGSMSTHVDYRGGTSRAELASASALALGDALDPLKSLGVSFGISGFTTGQTIEGSIGSLAKDSYAVASMEETGGQYDRLKEPLEHSTWHTHGEDWRRTKLRLGLVQSVYGMRNNADGEALMWMQRHFSKVKAKRKILIVLSDGSPACYCTTGDLEAKTRLEVLNLERQGVEVFGIGLGSNAVATIYSSFCVLNDEKELETVLLDKLTAWLLERQR